MILVTGGAGFLGSEVTRLLALRGEHVRVLVLPGDPLAARLPENVEVCFGDLLSDEDLDRFFQLKDHQPLTVIHCAGLITMSMKPVDRVYRVNVLGTQRIISHCLANGVNHLIHVASVHAIPELLKGQVMAEPDGMDPDKVVGYYAKTKAQAVARVMDARRKNGLRASVVYPAGLCGPGDYARGNLTQMFLDYMDGGIPLGVKGGYNFADVRDVARSIVTLALSVRAGEDYVMAGEYISIMKILQTFQEFTGGRKITAVCPVWLAKAALPLLSWVYKRRKVKPIFSAYSLYTIASNSLFDSKKARSDLDYRPRPIRQTLRDTANWLMAQKKLVPSLE